VAFLLRVSRYRGLSGAIRRRWRSFDCGPWLAGFLTHCLADSVLGDERSAQRTMDLCAHKRIPDLQVEYVLSALSNQEEKAKSRKFSRHFDGTR
jgi:hypothetical protein